MFAHTMLGDNEQSDMYQSYNDIIMHVILNKYKMYKAMHKLKGCSLWSPGTQYRIPPPFVTTSGCFYHTVKPRFLVFIWC